MIELGRHALDLALPVALVGALMGYIALFTRRVPLYEAARRCVMVNALLLFVAAAALVAAFLQPAGVPMELRYVWANSSRDMAGFYKLAALWGGMAGSLLFWAALLGVLGALAFMRPLPPRGQVADASVANGFGTQAGAIGTVLLVQAFFVYLMHLDGCRPFVPLEFPQADGRGLNPLLQHPAMAIHPPLLYIGFVSITMPFAYAIGALLSGELGKDWIVRCRRWTIFGWTILSVGIVLGGYWAYVELGWGGVWAWDPVENASFLPWLVMTAFLHSVMIQEHRGMLKVWNLVLVVLSFFMTIFATFLTRSGILESVHTFAENQEVKMTFLYFMGAILLVGGALIAARWMTGELKSENRVDSFFSREFTFLANNWLFLSLTVTITWGTLLPVTSSWINGPEGRTAVAPPWFNLYTIPQFLLLLILMGVGPLIAWRKASWRSLGRNFLWPAVAGVGVAIVCAVWIGRNYGAEQFAFFDKSGRFHWPPGLAAAAVFGGSAFVAGVFGVELWRGVAARMGRHGESARLALWLLLTSNRRRYGGYIVHMAVLLIMIGFAAHSAFKVVEERTLRVGESMQVGPYTLTYERNYAVSKPEYSGLQAAVQVREGGAVLGTLVTENRTYHAGERAGAESSTTSEVAIYKTLTHDLYLVAVGHPREGTTFLVHVNPLIDLVFLGTFLLALGSLFAAWPGGRRTRRIGRAEDGAELRVDPADLRLAPEVGAGASSSSSAA